MQHFDAIWYNVNLATMDPSRDGPYGAVTNAVLAVKDGLIAFCGPRAELPVYDALATPAVTKRLQELGVRAQPGTPAQMEALLATEIRRWRDVIQAAKIELQ